MFTEHLKDLTGLGIYPLISLILFLLAFVMIILRVITVDKDYLKKMEALPLELNNEDSSNIGI